MNYFVQDQMKPMILFLKVSIIKNPVQQEMLIETQFRSVDPSINMWITQMILLRS